MVAVRTIKAHMTNAAPPADTNAVVQVPARPCCRGRSKPTTAPIRSSAPSLRTNSNMGMAV